MRRTALVGALLFATTAAAQGDDSRARAVTVEVVSAIEGAPLGYSVVAIAASGIERFTGANGTVVILVRPGEVRISAKRLGFIPKDTVVTIVDAPAQRVRIALGRLTFRLSTVRVDARRACTLPGVPRADVDSVSRDVLGQLRQNAERFDLLLKTYPFVYTLERTLSQQQALDGAEVTNAVDTLLLPSDPQWSYRPGTVLRRLGGNFRSNNYAMRLPSLRDLASTAFIENHCFRVAGIEEKAGQRLLRMDIMASAKLREPDIHATVWLDTADFRIRFATLTLTRIPDAWRHLESLTSEITYLELLPYVPVMYNTAGISLEKGDPQFAWRWFDRQQVLDVQFLGARPDSLRPDSAARRPPAR